MSDRDIEVRIIGDLNGLDQALTASVARFRSSMSEMSSSFSGLATRVSEGVAAINGSLSSVGVVSNAASSAVRAANASTAQSLASLSATLTAAMIDSKRETNEMYGALRNDGGVIGKYNEIISKTGAMSGTFSNLGSNASSVMSRVSGAVSTAAAGIFASFQRMSGAISSVFSGLMILYLAFNVLKSLTDAVGRSQSATYGLASAAKFAGISFLEANNSAKKLSADGMMSITDTSKSLQNLMTKGFSLDQAETLISRLKDAAAFNRQASFSFSDAVVRTTEGIKMEMSTISDAAGVQKNLDMMKQDYAKTIGKTVNALNAEQRVLAIYNGFMKESEQFIGNAAKAQATFTGQLSKTEIAVEKLKVSMGDFLTAPLKSGMLGIQELSTGLSRLFDYMSLVFNGIGLVASTAGTLIAGVAAKLTGVSGIAKMVGLDLEKIIDKAGKFSAFKLDPKNTGTAYVDMSPEAVAKRKAEPEPVELSEVMKQMKKDEGIKQGFYKQELKDLQDHLADLEKARSQPLRDSGRAELEKLILQQKQKISDREAQIAKDSGEHLLDMNKAFALSTISIDEQKNQMLFDSGQISESKLFNLKQTSLTNKFGIEKNDLRRRRDLIKGDGDDQVKERMQIDLQLKELGLAYNNELIALRNEDIINRKEYADAIRAIEIDAAESLSEDLITAERNKAKLMRDTGKISLDQLSVLNISYSNREYDAKLAAKNAELEIAISGGEKEKQAVLKIRNEILDLQRDKYQAEIDLKADTEKKKYDISQSLLSLEIQSVSDVASNKLALEQQSSKELADLLQISKEEQLRREVDYAQRSIDITVAKLQAEKALKASQGADDAVLKGYDNQIESAQMAGNLRVQQANHALTMEMKKDWISLSSTIQSSLGTALFDQLTDATKSARQIWNGFMKDMTMSFTKMVSDMVARWVMGQVNIVAASAWGSAQRVAMSVWESTKTLALMAATAIKAIAMFAYQAAAGAYQAIVSIPYIGPVLAPAAAAVALGGVLAFGAGISAAGGYDIPKGMNPVVQTHAEEMILPAKHADVIRNMADGGGPSQGNNQTVNINAVDAQSVARLFRNNGVLAKATYQTKRSGGGLRFRNA